MLIYIWTEVPGTYQIKIDDVHLSGTSNATIRHHCLSPPAATQEVLCIGEAKYHGNASHGGFMQIDFHVFFPRKT